MLSCDTLGINGRLGNQMFQYAALKGIARNRNFKFCIPKDNHELFTCFKLNKDVNIKEKINLSRFNEKKSSFDTKLFNDIDDNTDLYGYFQTEKYFKNIENEIRKDFIFKDEIYEKSIEFIKNINSENICSIHIRRGDYLNLQHFHGLCTPEYYLKCISNYKDNKTWKFLIFSDDIKWCRQRFIHERYIFSENNSNFVDLCLMSMCKHNIIANSSFSWWGAWLNTNKDKKVYAPAKWYNANIDTQDLYCEDWVKI